RRIGDSQNTNYSLLHPQSRCDKMHLTEHGVEEGFECRRLSYHPVTDSAIRIR
ncbi:hypothetical protein TSMEX_011508, partial [Taenia solium]